jgi:preprotein translocase subunit YajC
MFASEAFAQTATPAAGAGGQDLLLQFLPLVALMVLFYFLLIRPQQRRAKQHRDMISAVKRNDTVVLASGIVGKVTKVEETEVMVEIAPNTNVRVVKAMIGDVRTRGEPAVANDTKG